MRPPVRFVRCGERAENRIPRRGISRKELNKEGKDKLAVSLSLSMAAVLLDIPVSWLVSTDVLFPKG